MKWLCKNIPIALIIIIMLCPIVFSFIVSCPTFDGGVFNFKILAIWLIPSIASLISALTVYFIYRQIKQEREFQEFNIMPRISIKKVDKNKNKNNIHIWIGVPTSERKNLTYKVSFSNVSNNPGIAQIGVIALIYDHNTNKILKHYLLGEREHKPFDMKTNINIYPDSKIIHSFTYPHHFLRDEERKPAENLLYKLKNKKNTEEKDYDYQKDQAFFYYVFLARYKSSLQEKWFYTKRYFYFCFSSNEFQEIMHLNIGNKKIINDVLEEKNWDIEEQ